MVVDKAVESSRRQELVRLFVARAAKKKIIFLLSIARRNKVIQHRSQFHAMVSAPSFQPCRPRANRHMSTAAALERMMTLYGMLKSGVGMLSRVVGVWSCKIGWRARRGRTLPPPAVGNDESVEFSSPADEGGGGGGGGGARSKTVAPGMEKPRFESAGHSVYQRLAVSCASVSCAVALGGIRTIAWSVVGRSRAIAGV